MQHELDDLAKTAAVKGFIPNGNPDDEGLARLLIDFVDGFSFDGGEGRVTLWTVDESFILVVSRVDGEDQPSQRVILL